MRLCGCSHIMSGVTHPGQVLEYLVLADAGHSPLHSEDPDRDIVFVYLHGIRMH